MLVKRMPGGQWKFADIQLTQYIWQHVSHSLKFFPGFPGGGGGGGCMVDPSGPRPI